MFNNTRTRIHVGDL